MSSYVSLWLEHVPRAALQQPGPVWGFVAFAVFAGWCQLNLLRRAPTGATGRSKGGRVFDSLGAVLLAFGSGLLLVAAAFPGMFHVG